MQGQVAGGRWQASPAQPSPHQSSILRVPDTKRFCSSLAKRLFLNWEGS